MSVAVPRSANEVRDVVGVGFGPGNLGLAIALQECDEQIDACFIERRESFGWHPGMLLPGTNMQISFLKDLATMRNPQSRFTFVNYLQENRRLPDFINRQTFTPERVEFADYLAWVARNVAADVRYGTQVTGIVPAGDEAPAGARFAVEVLGPDAAPHTIWTRCVVVASGLREQLPEWASTRELTQSGRVFHNHRFLDHLENLENHCTAGGHDRSYLVVGGGQSAAEVAAYLHDTGATVQAAFHGYGYAPADDSPFANRVFDPSAVDDFYNAPADVRADLRNRHRYTNYACVEPELLSDLFDREYREKVTGTERLRFHRATAVQGAEVAEDGRIRVVLADRINGIEWTTTVDAVVCATGFTSSGLRDIFPHAPVQVARDHHATVNGECQRGLFVQGATEATHGIGSTLLSNIAVRSGELADALCNELVSVGATSDIYARP